ncbi:MAG: DNA polymerase I [Planctomycetota bacterium]
MDSHSLIFQVFHAIPEMTSPQGEPVNAVYGFTRDLLYLIQEKRPDALVAAFDHSGQTFRHDFYPEYKGDRGEMPEALRSQLPKIERVVEALGVPRLALPGYEADDILAALATRCDAAGARCLLVTGDKDCRQLISDHVAVYNIRKDHVYDEVALHADWGIRPNQVVDFQSLVGDKVDNVPGVPLIGPKTATTLLNAIGTLDEVLAQPERAKGAKTQKNLREHREQALLSRRLVQLDRETPVVLKWKDAELGGADVEALRALFAEFGFRSLGDRLGGLDGAPPEEVAWESDYRLVDTPEKLAGLAALLASQQRIAVDTETTAINPREAELVGMSFAWAEGEACYVPVRGPQGEALIDRALAIEALRPVLEDPAIKKVGQNLKYDAVVLRGAGVVLRGIEFDTMVASYLLDAGERNHNLDFLASRYLGHTTTKISELIGKGKNQKRMDQVPVAVVGPYAAEDADVPLRLAPMLDERLDRDGLTTLNADVEAPLIEVLAEMEWNGVRVETSRLAELSVRYAERLQALAEQIEELAGHPFNIASPKQLAEVLFQELGLPVVKKTKTGPSTDAGVLEQLAEQHPLPRLIVEHRQYAKLKGTYVDSLPGLVHAETGRVHGSFNQVVAATGRLSSSDPNLQNIPIRTAEGREIRSAFTAGAGPGYEGRWKLLAADYSQIELRVLAHYSQDDVLCRAFADDQDIHTLVASQVNGVPLDEVDSDMRRGAKAVNFGIIYGQSPFGLAKALGITKEEAAAFITDYFDRYPGVRDFMQDTLNECREQGFVETLLGRRRAISGVRKIEPPKGTLFDDRPAPLQLNLPERTAVNTVIQGAAADLIKLAMLAVYRRMQEEGLRSKLILQIHDELLFDAPEDEIEALSTLVRDEMQGVMPLRVPLRVDIKTGDTWSDC